MSEVVFISLINCGGWTWTCDVAAMFRVSGPVYDVEKYKAVRSKGKCTNRR